MITPRSTLMTFYQRNELIYTPPMPGRYALSTTLRKHHNQLDLPEIAERQLTSVYPKSHKLPPFPPPPPPSNFGVGRRKRAANNREQSFSVSCGSLFSPTVAAAEGNNAPRPHPCAMVGRPCFALPPRNMIIVIICCHPPLLLMLCSWYAGGRHEYFSTVDTRNYCSGRSAL